MSQAESDQAFKDGLPQIIGIKSKTNPISLEDPNTLRQKFESLPHLDAVKQIVYVTGSEPLDSINFLRFISRPLKNDLFFMTKRAITDSEQLEFDQITLSDGGRNLAQFLFYLKMSPALKRRQQFSSIQEKFKVLFKAQLP